MVKNGVVKPSKARKMRYKAPNHVRRKFLSAPLSPSLKTQHGTRTMPVIKDDTVTITKGDRKLTEGKVIRVDTKEGRVYIEGVTRTRLDGSTVQIPIRTENVMITKLKMDDDMRKRMLERRAFSFKKES
ncbi:50S ribosomal protein L24 [Candidatus Bathyarchaeota archaeon]|jgi:large subunit ribosomal protein L24|nr:50S ribosomal protein L24 [Candidatus Bathyarchaeota archaeon]MCJ7574287.1 50S ribosomal protein L24 [Candidatus Bathyarchaeota archaeon]